MQPIDYILYSDKLEKCYIGETDNLEKRLSWHNDPNLNADFSRKGYQGCAGKVGLASDLKPGIGISMPIIIPEIIVKL